MIETGNRALITHVISSFTRDNQALVHQLYQIIYWFRGALTREDMWAMSPTERDLAIDFINERFKDAAPLLKQHVPVFL